jgi:CheY-like chemotaxis protein
MRKKWNIGQLNKSGKTTLMSKLKNYTPVLLLAEAESSTGPLAEGFLRDQDCKLVVARSIREALELLTDLHFIEGTFDAVLTDYELKDGSGTEVLKQSKRQFPDVPAAIIAPRQNIHLRLWTNVRGVEVLEKNEQALKNWLRLLQVPVHG